MKIFLLLTFFTVFITVFPGCGKDDDDNNYIIEIGTVQGEYHGAAEMKAISSAMNQELASASTKSKPIKLKLPAKVASKYMIDIGSSFPSELYNVSNSDALWTEIVNINGYTSGTLKGEFVQVNMLSDKLLQYVFYVYVDKDVTIKGGYYIDEEDEEFEMNVDLSLKAGWNQYSQKVYLDDQDEVYKVVIESRIIGSLVWYFFED